jgi:hypothetical protein
MVKCVDKGIFTCIGRNGKPKVRYDNDGHAISAAKLINESDPKQLTKLVAYKCTHCLGYHLTTHFKRIRK